MSIASTLDAGWQLWCFDEAIQACEKWAAEHAPVVLVYF